MRRPSLADVETLLDNDIHLVRLQNCIQIMQSQDRGKFMLIYELSSSACLF